MGEDTAVLRLHRSQERSCLPCLLLRLKSCQENVNRCMNNRLSLFTRSPRSPGFLPRLRIAMALLKLPRRRRELPESPRKILIWPMNSSVRQKRVRRKKRNNCNNQIRLVQLKLIQHDATGEIPCISLI